MFDFSKSRFWKNLGLVLTVIGAGVAFIAAEKEHNETISEVTNEILNSVNETETESE